MIFFFKSSQNYTSRKKMIIHRVSPGSKCTSVHRPCSKRTEFTTPEILDADEFVRKKLSSNFLFSSSHLKSKYLVLCREKNWGKIERACVCERARAQEFDGMRACMCVCVYLNGCCDSICTRVLCINVYVLPKCILMNCDTECVSNNNTENQKFY